MDLEQKGEERLSALREGNSAMKTPCSVFPATSVVFGDSARERSHPILAPIKKALWLKDFSLVKVMCKKKERHKFDREELQYFNGQWDTIPSRACMWRRQRGDCASAQQRSRVLWLASEFG